MQIKALICNLAIIALFLPYIILNYFGQKPAAVPNMPKSAVFVLQFLTYAPILVSDGQEPYLGTGSSPDDYLLFLRPILKNE